MTSSRVRPPALLPTRGYSGFSDGGTTPHSATRGDTSKGSHLRRSSFGAASPGPELVSPPWSLVPDMFHARYYPPLSHTEPDWRPLDNIHLSLDARVNFQEALQPARRLCSGRLEAEAASLAAGMEGWQSAMASGDATGATRGARQQLLFQYKPYAQQEALEAGAPAVAAVVEAVFGPAAAGVAPSSGAFASLPPEALWDSSDGSATWGLAAGASTGEVAATILIKLVMDNYLRAGARAAYAPTLFLLQTALTTGTAAQQARVFDLLFNLSLHGELLHSSPATDGSGPTEAPDYAPDEADWRRTVNRALRSAAYATSAGATSSVGGGSILSTAAAETVRGGTSAAGVASSTIHGLSGSHGRSRRKGAAVEESANSADQEPWPVPSGPRPTGTVVDARVESFQHWLRLLLFRLLLRLSSLEGVPEAVWVAALCALSHFSIHDGRTVRAYVEELPLSALASLLDRSREWRWAPTVHEWLLTVACNLVYTKGDGPRGAGSRSLKSPSATESLRSSTNRRRTTAHSQSSSEAWWLSAILDVDRILDFGGMRQLLRCYREAATFRAQNNVFCVIYDYITSAQGQQEYDSWAPSLGQGAHSSEVVALGAALLHLRAAQALRPLFLAGTPGSMPSLADELATQMAAVQAVNPGRVIAVPPPFVSEVLGCLEDVACHAAQVPRALEESVKHSLEVVAAEEVLEAASSTREDAQVWDTLVDCLRDQSDLGGEIARGWLLKLLLASAEQELQRSSITAPPALLPEVTPHGCQLAPGQRGITSQDRLRDLLERALATTGDARAADAFIDAVQPSSLPAAAEGGGGSITPTISRLHTSQRFPTSRTAASATPLLGGSTAPEEQGGEEVPALAGSVSGSAAGGAVSSYSNDADLEGSGSITDASSVTTDSVDVGQFAASERAGSWSAAAAPGVLLSTLGLAVEWLLQAPKEARRGAVLRAAQLLIGFIVQRPRPDDKAGSSFGNASVIETETRRRGTAVSSSVHRWVGSALGTLGEERSLTDPLPEPQGNAGGNAGATTSQVTATSAAATTVASSTPEMASQPGSSLAQVASRLSPRVSSGTAVPPSTPPVRSGNTSPRRCSLLSLDPPLSVPGLTPTAPSATQRALSLLRDGKVERASALLGPGARARLESERAAAAGAALAAALAERDTSTTLDAFLRGEAVVSSTHILHLPPLLLRALFDDLRPEQQQPTLFGVVSPRTNGGAGERQANAGQGAGHQGEGNPAEARAVRRAARAADAALGSKAAVLAERPLRDARAAMLLLLMARCIAAPADVASVGGPAFFASLLQEADPRIRRAASVFVLRHLMASRKEEYRAALRHVVARAQQANEETLVTDPYHQVKTLLDMQLIDLRTDGGGGSSISVNGSGRLSSHFASA